MPNLSDNPVVQDVPATAPAADARFHAARWQDLPGWGRDPAQAWWPVFLRNCQAILSRSNTRLPPSAPRTVNEAVWRPVCDAARSPEATANPQAFIEQRLRPWAVGTATSNGGPSPAMTTGYYEPLVNGSRERRGRFQWPLYGVPDDLITVELGDLHPELKGKRVRGRLEGRRLVPYDTRAEIESGQRSRPPVIVYTDDPIAAFFLQVQGSGRAKLVEGPDAGRTIRLAYADHNGHPYVSIGRWLIDRGELRLDQASMQGITAWTQRNPNRLQELLNVNPAMVFFREEALQGDEGPRGSMGVPLTAGRSIAVDADVIGMGSPIWLATTRPLSSTPLQSLVFAQDTGTAIRGTGRTDFFWGFGAEAGEEAGRMRQTGQQWLLWPAGQTPGRAGQPPG